MTRRAPKSAAALKVAASQTAPTSAPADDPAHALGILGAGSEAAASSNGDPDTNTAGGAAEPPAGGNLGREVALTWPAALEGVISLGGEMTITAEDLVRETARAVADSPEAWNALSVEEQLLHLGVALQSARDQVAAQLSQNDASDSIEGGAGNDAIIGEGYLDEPTFAGMVVTNRDEVAFTFEPLSGLELPSASPAPQDSGLASAAEAMDRQPDPSGWHITLLGSSEQPAMIDLGRDIFIHLGFVVAEASRRADMPPAEWNDQPDLVREQLIEACIEQLRGEIVDPPSRYQGRAVVRSRDDQPYRRCGELWTSEARSVVVHELVLRRLFADPFLIVRPDFAALNEA